MRHSIYVFTYLLVIRRGPRGYCLHLYRPIFEKFMSFDAENMTKVNFFGCKFVFSQLNNTCTFLMCICCEVLKLSMVCSGL